MTKPVIGIVGLGAMGLGIAEAFAQAGHPVIATDSFPTALETARDRLTDALALKVANGRMSVDERDAILAHVTVSPSLDAFPSAALVIEAIAEQLDAKRALFEKLEAIVSPETILATNTSSLSVAAIMQGLRHKGRGLGLHFFNPAPVMKLVELVLPDGVAEEAVQNARTIVSGIGKTVIACRDTPGFIVNRCARPFYGEALALLEEGRSASDIDAALLAAGYRLGPLSLIDLVGADINLAATESLFAAMDAHPRYHVFAPLRRAVSEGRLGRKAGRGFLFPEKPGPAPQDAEDIVLRIEAMLANEAASLSSECHIAPDDIDTAMKLGLNFPRGPFESARQKGPARLVQTLHALEAAAPASLKRRYQVQPMLAALR